MKAKFFLFIFTFSCLSLFGIVEKSIIPYMDQLTIKELKGKINQQQICEIEKQEIDFDKRLRVMSFNMLLNWSESHLDPLDRWENRKSRVVEYIQYAKPDIIGSQELQAGQLDFLFGAICNEYDFYGLGVKDGIRKGDIPAIFYRKDRVDLIHGYTLYFSETPECISKNPFGGKNTLTVCHFLDKKTGQEFIALNTHLAFGNMARRLYEACKLRDFLLANRNQLPIIITGDFNTFPFRQELDLPFYDGDNIVSTIECGSVIDSFRLPLFGHFGTISSTNFCSRKKKPFCSKGEPGVILDHIFVNPNITVISHGIDPAKIDGHYPSDHFPVIADVIIH